MMMHSAMTSVRLATGNDAMRIAAFVAAADDARAFHRPAWLAAVERACGHRTHVLLAETGGVLAALLPLHAVHSPLFGRALVSTGFAVDGGVIGDPAYATALAEAATRLAARLACTSVELRGGPLPVGPGWRLCNDRHAGFVAPLAADDAAQLAAIPRKQRAEVRKGLGQAMTVQIGSEARDRAMHYAVYARSVHNLGTPVFPRALFDAVLDAFGTDADILTVLADGQPMASVLSLYHRGTVMPYWGGGVPAARALRANDVMYYRLMGHARRRGCERFDFGRSKIDSGAWQFKRHWGFVPQPLAYAQWTAEGMAARDVNPSSPRYRARIALWRKLPLALANRLGPLIAGGLA